MRMRRIIILVLVGIAALVTWSIISSRHHYGSLEISAPAATPGNAHANVTVENDSGYKKSLVLSPGGKTTLRLKRGIYRVTGSAGSSKSITTVEVSGLRATLETPQGSQHAIQKIGSNAENCATAVANVTYSYNCGANGTVFQHVPLDPNRLATYNILFNSQKFTWLVPIQNGLIGFAVKENSPRELLFLNLQTQTVEPISLPSEVADALRSDEPSIITSGDSQNQHFALVFKPTATVYLFKTPQDTKPARVNLDKDLPFSNTLLADSFQLTDDHLVVFAGSGASAIYDDEKEMAEQKQAIQQLAKLTSRIVSYDFSGQETDRIKLPKDFPAYAQITKLAGDFYAALRIKDSTAQIYQAQKGELRPIITLANVANLVTIRGKLYMQVGGVLYVFQAKQNGLFSLDSLFSSPKITVQGLYGTPDGVIFTGYAQRSEGIQLDMYRLLDTPQQTPPLEETLSFDSLSDAIIAYDYDNQTVIFTLRYTNTPGATYDRLLSGLEQLLQDRHMNVGNRKITLTPFN